MAKIKVSPSRLKSAAKKIESEIQEYEKIYTKMVALIDSNQAAFDQATLTALQQSCRNMEKKFAAMKEYLQKITQVIKQLASDYEKANSDVANRSSKLTV